MPVLANVPTELVARYDPFVRAVARLYAPEAADADDFAQEAWHAVLLRIHTFRGRSKFRTWLYRVVVNTALMQLRHRAAEARAEARYAIGAVRSNSPLDRQFGSVDPQLLDGVRALPPGRRRIFWLIAVHDVSVADVAARYGIAPVTVRTQYLRARRALRSVLAAQPASPPAFIAADTAFSTVEAEDLRFRTDHLC